jgi:microcystin-dependent protein
VEGYIAQIIMFAGNFAPRNWAFCSGQILSIAQNTALFSLLGTTYGGNGQTTFALPDLRGRVPVGTGQGPGLANVVLGEVSGAPTHTLTINEMPSHNHTATFNGSTSALNAATVKATLQAPAAGALLAKGVDSVGTAVPLVYAPTGTAAPVALGGLNVAGTVTVGFNGGSQPFSVMQPYLGMNYVICLFGIFPSRN